MTANPKITLRVTLKGDVAMGPGKAELLAHLAATGSITAAAQKMNMSYRRAWLLIAELNGCFRTPVVETAKGGKGGGGGASLTPFGADLLKRYQAMMAKTQRAIAADFKSVAEQLV